MKHFLLGLMLLALLLGLSLGFQRYLTRTAAELETLLEDPAGIPEAVNLWEERSPLLEAALDHGRLEGLQMAFARLPEEPERIGEILAELRILAGSEALTLPNFL